jgi:tRNA (adenine-N(1)-)-methyltransferase non-catalytic subunit
MHSLVRPNTHLALRLPSGILKLVEATPNTYVNSSEHPRPAILPAANLG